MSQPQGDFDDYAAIIESKRGGDYGQRPPLDYHCGIEAACCAHRSLVPLLHHPAYQGNRSIVVDHRLIAGYRLRWEARRLSTTRPFEFWTVITVINRYADRKDRWSRAHPSSNIINRQSNPMLSNHSVASLQTMWPMSSNCAGMFKRHSPIDQRAISGQSINPVDSFQLP